MESEGMGTELTSPRRLYIPRFTSLHASNSQSWGRDTDKLSRRRHRIRRGCSIKQLAAVTEVSG